MSTVEVNIETLTLQNCGLPLLRRYNSEGVLRVLSFLIFSSLFLYIIAFIFLPNLSTLFACKPD